MTCVTDSSCRNTKVCLRFNDRNEVHTQGRIRHLLSCRPLVFISTAHSVRCLLSSEFISTLVLTLILILTWIIPATCSLTCTRTTLHFIPHRTSLCRAMSVHPSICSCGWDRRCISSTCTPSLPSYSYLHQQPSPSNPLSTTLTSIPPAPPNISPFQNQALPPNPPSPSSRPITAKSSLAIGTRSMILLTTLHCTSPIAPADP